MSPQSSTHRVQRQHDVYWNIVISHPGYAGGQWPRLQQATGRRGQRQRAAPGVSGPRLASLLPPYATSNKLCHTKGCHASCTCQRRVSRRRPAEQADEARRWVLKTACTPAPTVLTVQTPALASKQKFYCDRAREAAEQVKAKPRDNKGAF